jgi:hypothetical protein
MGSFAGNALISLLAAIIITMWRYFAGPSDDSGGILVAQVMLGAIDFIGMLMLLEFLRWIEQTRKQK